MHCRSCCWARQIPAILIRRPTKNRGAHWKAICAPTWMITARIPAVVRTFLPTLSANFRMRWRGGSFVTGVTFLACRGDGSYRDTFFIYTGTLPENCFIEQGRANGDFCTSPFLKQNYARTSARYPKSIAATCMLAVGTSQRAGLTDDEEGCFVPANCGYPKIYYGEHLRYSDKPNIELMRKTSGIINGTNCWRSVSRKSWMRCSKSAGCIRR